MGGLRHFLFDYKWLGMCSLAVYEGRQGLDIVDLGCFRGIIFFEGPIHARNPAQRVASGVTYRIIATT
jgi:hypothetical protein